MSIAIALNKLVNNADIRKDPNWEDNNVRGRAL